MSTEEKNKENFQEGSFSDFVDKKHYKDKQDKKQEEPSVYKETKKDKKVKVFEHELKELQTKANELDELKDTFLRKIADFENSKKRLNKEKEEFAKFANEKIISSFLPVLDNLDRALSHGSNSVTIESLASGVNLIKKQIVDILKDNGLNKIEALGKHFDPHFHEAVGKVETDEHPADMVIDEIQHGYLLKDKLLRPSWVRIAAPKESVEKPSENQIEQPEGNKLDSSQDGEDIKEASD